MANDVTSFIQQLIGTVGRRASQKMESAQAPIRALIGRNILPEFGLTEKMEAYGATPLTPEQRIEKLQQQGKTTPSSNPVEYSYQLQKGYVSPPSSGSTSGGSFGGGNQMPSMDQLIQMYKQQGWTDENAIRADIASGGWRNKIPQSQDRKPDNRDLLEKLRQQLSNNPDLARGLGQDDMNKILKDMEERGMSFADAVLARRRELAERYYQEAMAEAERRMGEVTSSAEMRKRHAKEQEEFYKGEMEKRKKSELEEIESQKEKAIRSYESAKDEIARNWRDLSRKFEAQARALGMSATSFVTGESRKLMNEFNSNLAKAWISHKDTVDELNRAVKKTIDTYDSKISELELNTRQMIEGIDNWLQEQVNRIRDMQGKALSYKMELIANAMDQADSLRNQILNAIDEAKLKWNQWLAQVQTQYALSAKYAAEGDITSANKSLDISNKLLTIAQKQISIGAADIVSEPKGDGTFGYYLFGKLPLTNEEYKIEIPDEEQAVLLKQKLKSVLETNPLAPYLNLYQ